MIRLPSTDGVTLALHDLGGEGPPLLLCHATGFHGRVWGPFAAALPHRHCYAIDFRGFGDSTAPADGQFGWRGFADDVLAVVDHLGLTSIQAVGHSKGGAAIVLAEQARPGTIERAVLFEPIVFPPWPGPEDPPPNHLAVITRRRRPTFDSFEQAIANYAGKLPIGRLRRDALEAYVHHGFRQQADGTVTLKADREHEARVYEMSHGHGAWDRLDEVRCPVLVLASGDGEGPATIAPLIADQLPAAEFRQMPEVAHFGPLEDPDAVAAVVDEFLSRA